MAQRVVIPGFRKIETSGESVTSYNDLKDLPSINNVPLTGSLKSSDLHLAEYGILTLAYEDENTLKGSIELSREIKSATATIVIKTDTAYKNINILGLNVSNKTLTVQALGMNLKEGDTCVVSYIAME